MGVKLLLRHGNESVGLELRDGVYVIGREKPADVVIPHPTISSRHAELQIAGGEWLLRDVGSTNGTFVNQVQIRAATRITSSDDVRLGSVQVWFQPPDAAPAPAGKTAQVSPMRGAPQAAAAARNVAAKMPWTTRYFIAGTEALLFLLLLVFFIQTYYASSVAKQRLVSHYRMFANQYMHVLRAREAGVAIPAPLLDDALAEPIMVADPDGVILYPPNIPRTSKSPMLDGKTNRVYERAKYGMFTLPRLKSTTTGDNARSYPVRAGGELVGYVIAAPGKSDAASTKIPALMLVLSGATALMLLILMLRRVHNLVRNDLEAVRSRILPLANGLVDSLPRSTVMPELSNLTDEAERVISHVKRQGSGGAAAAREGGGDDIRAVVADLVGAADIPYCFVDGDFKVVSSAGLSAIDELGKAASGISLFDSGLSAVQSKELVQALGAARKDGAAELSLPLTRRGKPYEHRITIRAYRHPKSGAPILGILFNQVSR